MKKNYLKRIFLAFVCSVFSLAVHAQCTFACGTGSDGAFLATSNTTLAGGTYNYSSFTIDSGVTVTVTGTQPLVIFCTGNVQINGTLNLSGSNGTDGITFTTAGVAGSGVAGGQNGGDGIYSSGSGPLPGSSGNGTGGGGIGNAWSGGGGAGYALTGDSASPNTSNGIGGISYGDSLVSSAIAGSGGAGGSGGYGCGSGGGGGGGGYISITACGTIAVSTSGSILANGGNGGSDGTGNCGGGGGGSGGSIRLLSNSTFVNDGIVSANGGTGGSSTVAGPPYFGTGGSGSAGRMYLAAVSTSGSGILSPMPFVTTVLSVTTTATSLSCYADSNAVATATVLGGIAPYTYSWSPVSGNSSTLNNLGAGTYAVTVTDTNGCTVTASVTITSPQQLLASVMQTATISCYGGSDAALQGSATGGITPYSYSWDTLPDTTALLAGIPAGVYTLMVTDANGCTNTSGISITQPPVLTPINSQTSAITCFGGYNGGLEVSPVGGTAPYTYAWAAPLSSTSNSVSNLPAGTYSVTVTDANGCTAMGGGTLTEPAVVSVTVMQQTDALCFNSCDGSATVAASGGTGVYTYQWSPSVGCNGPSCNLLCAGNHTVIATDSLGCTSTATLFVTGQPALLSPGSISHTDASTASSSDGSATMTGSGGTPPYSYNWMPGNQTTSTATGLAAGSYTCVITDANGCTAGGVVTIAVIDGIAVSSDAAFQVSLYPNPAQEEIQLTVTLEQRADVMLEVYNLVGEKTDAVNYGAVSSLNETYATSRLANGIYFFRVSSGNLQSTTKVIIAH